MKYETAEDIYQEFHAQTFFASHEIYPKKIVNFDEIKARPEWVYFEKLKDMIDRSHGMIDVKLFLEALSKYYEQRFDPANLIKLKSIKIYKNYVLERNHEKELKNCFPLILTSINNIVDECREKGLKTLDDYFGYGRELMPLLVKDLSNGRITYSFLIVVSNIDHVIAMYPVDIQRDHFKEFYSFYQTYKNNFFANATMRKLSDNLTNIINNKITIKK